MYNTTDENTASNESPLPVNFLGVRGAITEIEMQGKKVAVIDPSVVINMESTLKRLQSHIQRLETELHSLKSKQFMQERRIREITGELDNKVSYEK
jgi:predicted RNase H-like nuclease (RuvC/YqgF family)